jgi:hypothetical protein
VAVGVVRTDRDQPDSRAAGGEEVRIGVRAAVVRHLEDVGPQVGPVREEPRLGVGTQVSGEQDRQARNGHADHEGQVVGRGGGDGPLGGRGEDLHRDAFDAAPVARYEHGSRTAGKPHEPVEGGNPVVGRREGAGGHHADFPAGECARQAARVVGVEVGDQDQRQHVDAQPVQAPVHGTDIRAGVDQYRRPRTRGEDEGVALPHVAADRHGSDWRPAPHRLAERPADHDQADDRGQGQGAQAGEPPQRPATDQQEHGERDRPGGSGRPPRGAVRHACGASGHEDQPARRPAGHPDQGIGHLRQERPHQRREQAEDGPRGDGGRSQQIGGQGDEADRSREAGDDRGGDHPGGRADRDRVREDRPAPHLPQPAGPAGREQDDACSGRHGEREARVPGEAGVEQEEHTHPRCQGRDGRPRATRRERHQGDNPHGGSPHHTGTRAGQDHEADQGQDGQDGLHSPVHRPPAERSQHSGQHDRDVGAGHRGEVRQPRSPEVRLDDRIHRSGVADGEAGEQPRGGGIQDAPRRVAQGLAQRTGRPLQMARLADERGWPASRDHRDHVVPRLGKGHPDPDPDLLSREHTAPLVRRPEEQHLGVEVLGGDPIPEEGHGGVGDDAGRPRPAQHMRIVPQLEDDGRGPLRRGYRAQW